MSDARSDTGESTEGPARRAVRRTARGPLLAALCVAAVACGTTETSNTSVPDSSTSAPSSTVPSSTVPSSSVPPSTDTPTTVAPPLEQPAIWPAAGDFFDLPELAAADFVVRVLGVPPVLGPFMA
ncbi:MAG: hypothetical protein ACKOAZ_02050, partial [Ilumatobacteraceae bacterium]